MRSAKKTTTGRNVTKSELEDVDAIWHGLMRENKGLLTREEALEEDRLQCHEGGRFRRVTLLSAAEPLRHWKDLANKDRASAAVVATMMLSAQAWCDDLKRQLGLAECQALRLKMALCEVADMPSVIAEAQAEIEAEGETLQ